MRWLLMSMLSIALMVGLHAQRLESVYRLKPDDQLFISVFGAPEMSQRVVVSRDGTIMYNAVGTIRAVGLTPDELAQRIREELIRRRIFTDVDVTVIIEQFHRPRVAVIGFVNRPGVYEFKEGDRVLDALSLGGNIIPDRARLEDAWLQRMDGTVIPINLRQILEEGKLELNIPLQDGDTLFVPEETENRFFVGGQVKRPGQYTWRPRMTVLDALGLAGWETDRAALSRTYVVRQGPNGEPQQILVDMVRLLHKADLSQNIVLQPGDVVYVSETRTPDIDRIYRGVSLLWLLRNLGILDSLWRP